MKQDTIETIIGFAIIIVATAFFIFAYNTNNPSKTKGGYIINANFENTEGIIDGSDVMLAGIKIGTVESLSLDKANFLAILRLRIYSDVKLPNDSQAAVASSGFLGGKFISITPGSSEENLKEHEQIKYTHSSLNIEALIGKLIYAFTNKKE